MEEVPPSPSDAVDEWGPFHCQICLDLVYKPIVQACGHIFCFWCIHKAMNGVGTSHCPLCRRPYKHFPRVCELLHYFLFKAFPEEYRQREEEVLEMEKRKKIFSPQLSDPPNAKRIDRSKLNSSSSTEGFAREESLQSEAVPESTVTSKYTTIISSDEKIKSGTKLIHQCASSAETSLNMHNVEANIVQDSVAPNTLNGQDNAKCYISQNNITVDDVLCCYCEELIYQPTVLNCGHAFCESCISISEIRILKCQICQSLHPGDQPHVCLELHYFLECTFPAEYAERKKKVLEHEQMCQQPNKDSATCLTNVESNTAQAPDNPSQETIIHPHAGCDYCGILPIVGKRYKCMDCLERIGFDLCERCYEKGLKLPGRFNQRHTEEHRFQALHGDSRSELVLPDLMNPVSWIAEVIPVDLEH